jgi:hypothetical protein
MTIHDGPTIASSAFFISCNRVRLSGLTFFRQSCVFGFLLGNREKIAFVANADFSRRDGNMAEKMKRQGPTSNIQRNSKLQNAVWALVVGDSLVLGRWVLEVARETHALATMLADAKAASEKFARAGEVTVSWERLWHIVPRPFNDELIALCDAAIRETCGKSHRMPSGPLHDDAEMAAAGVPTVMMFVQSLHGISHNKIEDTKEEHLELSVAAFDNLAEKAMKWIEH